MRFETIEELINSVIETPSISVENTYVDIPHKSLVCKKLNSLLCDVPEYYPTIKNVCEYRLNKWCQRKRAELKLDFNFLELVSNEYYLNYFGFKMPNNLKYHKLTIKETEDNIKKVEEIFNNKDLTTKESKLLNCLFKDNTDISEYRIEKLLNPTIKKIALKYNDYFMESKNKIKSLGDELDDEIKIAYHNTDLLVRNLSELYYLQGKQTANIDYGEVCKTLNQCIYALKDYDDDGEMLYKVMLMYSQGYNERNIMKTLNKSQTYVKGRYKKGITIMSVLVWGLGAKGVGV